MTDEGQLQLSREDQALERGSCVSEMTQEDALRLADELVEQALKEAGGRCSVLAVFIEECDRAGAMTSGWSAALRELHALHASRRGLLQRRSLIQQALECPVGESPSKVPPPEPPKRTAIRPQRQIQVQMRRRASRAD
jgi:hypothetical protein